MSTVESILVWCGVGGCAALLLPAAAATFAYAWSMARPRSFGAPPARPPRIDVLSPVRGGGPELRVALEHLLQLDYPNFFVNVIIDRPGDPAVPIVVDVQREFATGRLTYDFLTDRPPTRSLVCSALVQLFEKLDPNCDLITFCGADINFPQNFLADMAAPMTDPSVGSTLGNRWYVPEHGSWGSIARYLYNAGAVVPMWMFGMAWGGAAVLRPDDVRRSGLLDLWKAGMVEDAPIAGAMQRLGKRMVTVPQLTVPCHGPISLGACFEFLKRQLMWTRLYHASWPAVVAATLTAVGFVLLLWTSLAVSLVLENWQAAGALAAVIAMHWCGSGLLLVCLEATARRLIRKNGGDVPQWSVGLTWRVFLAIPAVILFYGAAVCKVVVTRSIAWSNVEYEIGGPNKIRMLADRPLEPAVGIAARSPLGPNAGAAAS